MSIKKCKNPPKITAFNLFFKFLNKKFFKFKIKKNKLNLKTGERNLNERKFEFVPIIPGMPTQIFTWFSLLSTSHLLL